MEKVTSLQNQGSHQHYGCNRMCTYYQTKATFAKHIILQLANNDGTQTADTIAKSPGMMLCPTRNNSEKNEKF